MRKSKKQRGIFRRRYCLRLRNKKKYQIQSKVIINATGVFADSVIKMDDPDADEMIQPSQGTHIVLDASFLPGKYAIMVPKTKDGRH